MPLYIDNKYVNLVAYKLRNFKVKAQNYYSFSCPICGDSKKDPRKARGFFLLHKHNLIYKCHNCGISCGIGPFLKRVDANLYSEYRLENYRETVAPVEQTTTLFTEVVEQKVEVSDSILDSLIRIDSLQLTHPVIQYIIGRKIPRSMWDKLYFTKNFKEYTNSVKFTFTSTENDHPRLVIPFFDEQGNVFAFQGRAFGNEQPKYYTIKLDEDKEKIYGLDRINTKNRIYVVEGPIDSLFLPNAIAVTGSSFDTPTIRGLANVATIVVDNEPRNKEVMNNLDKYIQQGYSVCIWPDHQVGKDINEMIQNGQTVDEIVKIINENTASGLEAQLKYNQWRKCK